MRPIALVFAFVVACETPVDPTIAPGAPSAEPPSVETAPPAAAAAPAVTLPDGNFLLPDGASIQVSGGKVQLVQGGGLVEISTSPTAVAGREGVRLELATGPLDVVVADGNLMLGDGTGLARQ
jgi:hypothetical protein